MRTPRVDKNGIKQGAWSAEEDQKLIDYISKYRIWNWGYVAKFSGLSRNGKSCRLRWVNYLNPAIKRGNITKEEEKIIVDMYAKMGSRWSKIAKRLPGRTDNEIKNYWYTRLKKRSNENSTQRIEPLAVEIPTLEANVENSDVSRNITPASVVKAINSPAGSNNIPIIASASDASNSVSSSINNIPMITANTYKASNSPASICNSSVPSIEYASGLHNETKEIKSTDSLQTIGDFQNFWSNPYVAGNMYMEDDQLEAYVHDWYQDLPLSSCGLFNNAYWLTPDAHTVDVELLNTPFVPN